LKTGRNDPCPCGSGKKYKKCCLAKDEALRRERALDPGEKEPVPLIEETEMPPAQLIDAGYRSLEKKKDMACGLWFLAWRKLKPFIEETGVTSAEQLDRLYERPLSQWFRDLEREMAVNRAWVNAFWRMLFAGDFMRLLPDSTEDILAQMRQAAEQSRVFLERWTEVPDYRRESAEVPSSPDGWADAYEKASELEQYHLFMAIARRPEQLFADSLDLGDFAVDLLGRLQEHSLQEQVVEVAATLQANWPDYYAQEFPYFDFFLANRALYLGEDLSGPLGRFTANPTANADYFVLLFSTMVAYQHEMAVPTAEKVFSLLQASEKVVDGTEYRFGLAVFADRLEKLWAGEMDWQTLEQAVAPFGFGVGPKMARDIDRLWSGGFTAQEWYHELERDFNLALTLLGYDFCRAMREQKGMAFPCALLIWTQFEDLVWESRDRSKTDFPDFSREAVEDMLVGKLGIRFLGLSSEKSNAFVLLWGLPYVYGYLSAQGVADDGLRGRVLDRVARLKDILFERVGDDLWKYAFVRRWDESANAYEDDVFDFSFRRREPLAEKVFGGRR